MITIDRDQAAWGSRRSYDDRTLLPVNIDKIVIHWGGRADPGNGEADEAKVLRGWQRYHIDTKEWVDIAYNYAVGNSGLRWRLRGWNRAAATAGDIDNDGIPENVEALALVWIGGTAGAPSDAAYVAMGQMIRDVFDELSGEVPVTVHSDHRSTRCPGDEWRAWRDRRGWDIFQPPSDVFAWDWEWAIDAGIMTVDSDPHKTVTKQEMAAFMHRLDRHIRSTP